MEIQHYVETRLWTNEFVGLSPSEEENMSPECGSLRVATDGILAEDFSIICGNDDEANGAKWRNRVERSQHCWSSSPLIWPWSSQKSLCTVDYPKISNEQRKLIFMRRSEREQSVLSKQSPVCVCVCVYPKICAFLFARRISLWSQRRGCCTPVDPWIQGAFNPYRAISWILKGITQPLRNTEEKSIA